MKLVFLVPIAPTDEKAYRNVVTFFSTMAQETVYGLDDDDVIGHDALLCLNAHVVTIGKKRPFPICALWNKMATYAFRVFQADLVLMLGDDVVTMKADKMITEIQQLFDKGADCIAVREESHPGWPTFLATSASYFPIPEGFVNQDADPFMYECARRKGRAAMTSEIYLYNITGGVEFGLVPFVGPRYQRVSYDWRTHEMKYLPVIDNLVITIDVAVPMHRPNPTFIRSLLNLPTPIGCDVRICICLDCAHQSISAAIWKALREMELANERLRIRVNAYNMGASATRTRLLSECHSDYILFLDDDVVVDRNLLIAYADAIKYHSDAKVFVGMSALPRDGRYWTDGMHASTTFFWHISQWASEQETCAPWGVTANLLVKWQPGMCFDVDFPKSGGGEDVDFCIRLGGECVPVPAAKITHPWRASYMKMLRRLFEWAYGDVLLQKKHRRYAYMSFPNAPECIWATLLFYWHHGTTNAFVLAYILCTLAASALLADIIWSFMVCHRLPGNQTPEYIAQNRTSRALIVCTCAFISHNASELGHLWGHVRRGDLRYIGMRFDWFLETLPACKRNQRIRDLVSCIVIGVLGVAQYTYFFPTSSY